MSKQQVAILVLIAVLVVVIVLFGVGVSFNSQGDNMSADTFKKDDFPAFKALNSLLDRFSPKLKADEIKPESAPSVFKILPSEKEKIRKAKFRVVPRPGGGPSGVVSISYHALKADEDYKDLQDQACTLSVLNTKQKPCSTNVMALRSPAKVKFACLAGSADVECNGKRITTLTSSP